MRKILFPMLAAIILLTISCNKNDYEETYDKKHRINKIWMGGESDTVASYIFSYDDDKRITKITDRDSADYVFEYGTTKKDKYQVLSITHQNRDYDYKFTEKIALSYDPEGYLSEMKYTIDGSVRKTYSFHRRENKSIVSIIEMYDFEFYNNMDLILKSDFYNFFLGEDQYVAELLRTKTSKSTLQLESITIPVYEKDPEDDKDPVLNVIKTYKTIPDLQITYITTYTYNHTLNPYFGMPFRYQGITSLSKNNKVTEYTEYTNELEFDTVQLINKRFEYQFDQYNQSNYPDKITEYSSDYYNQGYNTYILYHPTK